MSSDDKRLDDAKRIMTRLVSMPPKPHVDQKLGKPAAKPPKISAGVPSKRGKRTPFA